MGKKLTYEDAESQLETATKKRKDASAAKESYAKENSLKAKKDYSDDPKHGKAWKKLQATYLAAKEEETVAKESVKELKPKTVRATKYEYPDDCVTVDDKKKFRAKQRAAAKQAAKPAKEAKPEKASKKAAVEETPAKKKKKKVAKED